ncbi:glycosyltransferase family 2 protein [Mariprofundus micogutta]|uniref:glycosyltransferase family 2 protein n=1 Tax=Mariprofundus micogutta TaxID=1921010 RepID=UPI000933A16C|nr:glycosyltransferase family 2 protein [Mariprofundus micogutta]
MKISIITATWNCVDTISDCLDSASSQVWGNCEHLVIDGKSTDGTLDLLEQWRNRLDYIVSEPDSGIYDALNKGVAQATGDVIGFLHADDLYADNEVLTTITKAFEDPSIDAVYGDLVYVSKNEPDKVVRYWKSGLYSYNKLKHGWMPPHPTFYVRRSVYEQFGSFDTSFQIAADYDCMLRFLGQHKVKCAYIPQVLVKMRLGGESNRSLANIIQKSVEDYNALKRNMVGGVGALLWKNLSKLPQFFKRHKSLE